MCVSRCEANLVVFCVHDFKISYIDSINVIIKLRIIQLKGNLFIAEHEINEWARNNCLEKLF